MQADWVPAEEARDRVVGDARPLAAERLPLEQCLGRVLAEPVVSTLDLPPWDNSAMDGFAVRAEDVRGATESSPRELPVVDDIPAGAAPARVLGPGTAARIMTGAPVPRGADTVVRVEHTDGGREVGTERGRVRIRSDADLHRNIRPRGEDVRTGAVVLRTGAVVRAAEVGVGAALGCRELHVVRRPVVGILASGDELVELDGFAEVLAGRRIVSSNSYALAAQVREVGAEPRMLGIARDSPESTREHLEAARGCDALVTSAGMSVGEHDYLRDVLVAMGAEVAFWRIRMRPGSPFAYGRVRSLGGIPWFGLPGNPVSSMVTFELFVRPALLRMAGHTAVFPPVVQARFTDSYPTRPGRTHFARVRLQRPPGAQPTASLTGSQGSGILTSMSEADGLMVIAPGRPGAAPGDVLPTLLLGGLPLQEEAGW